MRILAALLLAAATQLPAHAAEPAEQARALAARAAENLALGFRHKALADLEDALALVKDRADARPLAAALLREHYDPAYRRSATHNFSRLADARVIKIKSHESTDFQAAARALLEEAVPA